MQKRIPVHRLKNKNYLFFLIALFFIFGHTTGWAIELLAKTRFLEQRKGYTQEEAKFVSWRWDLAEQLIKEKSITQKLVYDAFLSTPREHFIRKQNAHRAYEDSWMPIGYGVTITDPYTVCIMTETLLPLTNMKVLEIGTGTGYQGAILSNLTNQVYTIEIIKPLAKETQVIFSGLLKDYPQYKNINFKIDDGYYGWQEHAPYDRIIVTCGIDHIPPPLIQQLKPDGIMVIPVGPPGDMVLLKVTKQLRKNGQVVIKREALIKTTFVPFTNAKGGKHTANELE